VTGDWAAGATAMMRAWPNTTRVGEPFAGSADDIAGRLDIVEQPLSLIVERLDGTDSV
jgi:hypothetical protein